MAIRFQRIVLTAACLLVIQTGAVRAQADFSRLGDELDRLASEASGKVGAASLSLAVVEAEGVIWAKSYGFADKERNIAAAPDTLYHVGEISMLLTATEIMRRSERHELKLDEPLTTYLPGFAIGSRFAHGGPITIRALLAHHSGLPSQRIAGSSQPGALAALQEQLREEDLAEAPQTRLKQSSIGYSLLGRVIEIRSGKDFAQAIDAGLLQPLGMIHTSFATGAFATAKPHVAGKAIASVEARDRPARSLIASASELAQFVRLVLNEGRTAFGEPLLRPATVRSMSEPQFPAQPLDFGHTSGLGWRIEGIDIPGAGRVSWHVGQYPGYASLVAVAPERQLGVIVLSNDQMAAGLVVALGRKALGLAVAARLGRPVAKVPEPAAPKTVAYSDADLGEFKGDYVVFGQPVHVAPRNGGLSAEVFGRRVDLIPIARNRFTPKVQLLGSIDVLRLFDRALPAVSVRFVAAEGRRFALVEGLPETTEVYAFERIEDRPVPPAWLARLGRYHCDNPDHTIEFGDARLDVEDGLMIFATSIASKPLAQDRQDRRFALMPTSDYQAIVVGVGAGEGGTVRASDRGGHVSLMYSGLSFTRQP
jgi:CubicO group peptidase (beta-lactamase class C family)